MNRQEQKNFATKMQRMLSVAVKNQIKITDSEKISEILAENVAYAIFYRVCAMRFMEARGYAAGNVVSPGKNEKTDFLAACDALTEMFSAAFPPLTAEEKSFVPENLRGFSELFHGVSRIFPDKIADIRNLGWLYQFYHSEKKDAVFAEMKRGTKLSAEQIPAATQVFTPEWISEFLVENTLDVKGKWHIPPDSGHSWQPGTKRSESDRIEAENHSAILSGHCAALRSRLSHDIREKTFCDPACGCGHILLTAYDAFFSAYADADVPPHEIPEKILTKNLFGMEIDSRVAEAAVFSLLMKAREHDPDIFDRGIFPNIRVLRKHILPPEERNAVIRKGFRGKSREETETLNHALREDLRLFEDADLFGTLLRPKLTAAQAEKLLAAPPEAVFENPELAQNPVFQKTFREILNQVISLSRRYDVVVTNPPYMGSRGMSPRLVSWLNKHFAEVKNDLFSAFIVRNMELTRPGGQLGFMTPFVWMFISSYKKLRQKIFGEKTLTTLIQLEYSGFDGATVPICVFTLRNEKIPGYHGAYIRLSGFRGTENQAPKVLEAIQNPECGWFYRADSADFQIIPDSPAAYWLTPAEFSIFHHARTLREVATPRQGCATSDNKRFLRLWHESAFSDIMFGVPSLQAAKETGKRWFPYNKGGAFRKWSGNREYIINWENDGEEIKEAVAGRYTYLDGNVNYVVKNREYYFRESLSWSKITSSGFSLRYYPPGFAFDVSGCSLFCKEESTEYEKPLMGCLNSPVMTRVLNTLAPTLNFEVGQIAKFPLVEDFLQKTAECVPLVEELIRISDADWNSQETSWDFTQHPAFLPEFHEASLSAVFAKILAAGRETTLRMKALEEENNRIFLRAYGLDQTLTPEVSLKDITLRCNPFYRYQAEDSPASEPSLEARLLADTVKEFLSYAVGCIFGRYSVDVPGLILAGHEKTAEDFCRMVEEQQPGTKRSESDRIETENRSAILSGHCATLRSRLLFPGCQIPTFMPVKNNCVLITDDSISADPEKNLILRLHDFLAKTFGPETLTQNVAFLEKTLGKTLSKYFLTHFHADHGKMAKHRPIYWMFSSPAKTFNALVYLHRMDAGTLRCMLAEYLTPMIEEKKARREILAASPGNETHARTKIKRLTRELADLETYRDTILLPLIDEDINLSLDDGVKVNHAKFGAAVRKIF